jgi:ligand-binding sensor domain-containing protein
MLDMHSGLENEYVRSISQDKSGKVWLLSAEGGLGWWQDNVWHRMGHSEGWGGHDSLCVLATSDGSVWVSTARRGIWRGVNGHFSRQELGPSNPREPIVDFLEDRHGRLWMVTDNTGVYCFEGGKLRAYTTRDGLPSTYIRRMVEDDAGEVWVGDWEGGIARFREQRWELVRKPSGHKDAVRCMVASGGALWIGTSAGGLLRLKEGQTTRVSVEQGLPNVCIQQLFRHRQRSNTLSAGKFAAKQTAEGNP